MSNFKTYLTNWKIFTPVLGGALIIGAVIYNANTESSQNTTPAGETTANVQAESVEVEVEAATLEGGTEVPASDNTEK
tara:strand:+ start:229 stop:462 length:234 start_codon:yes stop_codon:yes gene_type:complete